MTRPGHLPPTRSKNNSNKTRDIDRHEQTILNLDSNNLNHFTNTSNSHGNHGIQVYQSIYGNRSSHDTHQYRPIRMTSIPPEENECPQSFFPGQNELRDILREVKYLTEKVKTEERTQEICGDWKFAAMVVDRICMIVFTLITIVSTIGIFLSAPSMWS